MGDTGERLDIYSPMHLLNGVWDYKTGRRTILHRAVPVLKPDTETFKVEKYTPADVRRELDSIQLGRGGDDPPLVTFSSGDDTFSVKPYGLGTMVQHGDASNVKKRYNKQTTALRRLISNTALQEEIAFATLATTLANYATNNKEDLTGGTLITDAGLALLTKVQQAKERIMLETGAVRFDMYISMDQVVYIRKNTEFTSALGSHRDNFLGKDTEALEEMFATVFGVDRVFISSGVKNTAGVKKTGVNTFVWGESIVIAAADAALEGGGSSEGPIETLLPDAETLDISGFYRFLWEDPAEMAKEDRSAEVTNLGHYQMLREVMARKRATRLDLLYWALTKAGILDSSGKIISAYLIKSPLS